MVEDDISIGFVTFGDVGCGCVWLGYAGLAWEVLVEVVGGFVRRVQERLECLVLCNPNMFVTLEPIHKFKILANLHLWEKSKEPRKRERDKKERERKKGL